MKQTSISVLIKGLIVGGTMLVPGVSGGSMAMILGIYQDLISAISSFFQDRKRNLILLTSFVMGGGLGMVLFARPLLSLIERYPMPMLYFFIGAVAGGIPMILKQAKMTRIKGSTFGFIGIGICMMGAMSLLPANLFQNDESSALFQFLLLMVAGILAAVALVLPGISVSYFLLLLGLYDEMMQAISELYIPLLIPLAIGLCIGIIATTKLLEHWMLAYPQATYLIILGFIFGSVMEIFPGIPSGMELLISILLFLLGFFLLFWLSKKEMQKSSMI